MAGCLIVSCHYFLFYVLNMEDNNEIVAQRVQEAFDTRYSKYLQIRNVMYNFFGEDRVDMKLPYDCIPVAIQHVLDQIDDTCYNQDGSLNARIIRSLALNDIPQLEHVEVLIYFPEVTVTNEHNESIDIQKIFIKVSISRNGTLDGTFTMNRSCYPKDQWFASYMHSHASQSGVRNVATFTNCCLGTGPIKDTCIYLNSNFDLDFWNMFCLELNNYMPVESLAGVPYVKLMTVRGSRNNYSYRDVETAVVTEYTLTDTFAKRGIMTSFFRYFTSLGKLKFSFNRGYDIGMNFYDYLILISNEFIKWFNESPLINKEVYNYDRLIQLGIIKKAVIKDGKIMTIHRSSSRDITTIPVGRLVCVFKGENINFECPDINDEPDIPEEENPIHILAPNIASYYITRILEHLNLTFRV